MAQKIQIILEDDLDGSRADENVRFSLDGVDYEIDLTTEHAKELRDLINPYAASARRLQGRPQRSTTAKTGAAKTGPATKEIRAWAQSQNMDVNPFGRIAQSVIDAYTAAH